MRHDFRPNRMRPKMKQQSLEMHKQKWLARLSCPTATVKVIQTSVRLRRGGRNVCRGHVIIISKGNQIGSRLCQIARKPLPFNAVVFRALDALVNEGKIRTSMSYVEWQTQLALGTANTRIFYK